MNVRQNDILEVLRSVQQFLDANSATLATVNSTGTRADLDAAVTQLTALALAQKQNTVQSQGETTKAKTLRTALIDTYMAPIAAIAKAKLATVPEFSSLALPKSHARTQTLLTAAGAMGNAAAPYASTFVAQGLPSDFVAQLATAASALEASVDGRKQLKVGRVGATAGVGAQVSDAAKIVKVLSTMVTPLLIGNPTLLAAWKNAKRIGGRPSSTTAASPTPTPTPAPVSTSSASTSSPAAPAAVHAA